MLNISKSMLKCQDCNAKFIGEVISGGFVNAPASATSPCPKCGSNNVSVDTTGEILDALTPPFVKGLMDIFK